MWLSHAEYCRTFQSTPACHMTMITFGKTAACTCGQQVQAAAQLQTRRPALNNTYLPYVPVNTSGSVVRAAA
jgi:hypothetical protein